MPNESHFRLWTASDDENRTTQFTYTADGALATLKALNATTGDQTTTYTYGTTLSNSAVATSVLLRQVQYPDSAGGSDVELFEYNRQTQPTKFTDQLGTVHQYDYDLLGRQTQDRVTTLGTNVDGAVRRIQTTYVVRGMLQKVTSYDNAAVGSGSIVNEVQRAYNHFRQLEFEYQSHSGAVNTGTSPKVTYGYADAGSGSNTNRPTSMTYPSGWKLNYDYGASAGMADALSRVAVQLGNDGVTRMRVNEITGITNSTGSAWAAPAYNAVGNMTTVPQPLALGSSYTATYDAWNRLVKLVDGANLVHQSAYDGLHRRTVKTRYTAGVLDEIRHQYYSAAWQNLEERMGTTPDTASANRRFVWGLRYIDDLVLRDRDVNGDGTMDERYYALQDPNWNVIALADINGDVQERFAYDAYGKDSVLTPTFAARASSTYGWEHRYAGYRRDGESGLYQVRHRFYHPTLGVWIGRDPKVYAGSMNLYEYVGGAPLISIDPSGTVLIAVDGTKSGAYRRSGDGFYKPTGRYRSHVRNFYEDYIPQPGEQKMYFDGPEWDAGTDADKIYAHAKLNLDAILSANPAEEIIMVGHSRGGMIVNELARDLQRQGFKVKFLGLYDPVDLTWDLGDSSETIPSNVKCAANAIRGSKDGKRSRPWMNTVDGGPQDISKMTRYRERKFTTTHGGMGGAPWVAGIPSNFCVQEEICESRGVDDWMRSQAAAAKVKLGTPKPTSFAIETPVVPFDRAGKPTGSRRIPTQRSTPSKPTKNFHLPWAPYTPGYGY